jgi:nucleotide-binding universal stress UspA family protein
LHSDTSFSSAILPLVSPDAISAPPDSHCGLSTREIGSRPDAPAGRCSDDPVSYTRRSTMERIVIATDGSPAAHEAVELGLELAAEQGAEPIFVHVVPRVDVVPASGFGLTSAHVHEVTESDRAPLEAAAEVAAQHGIGSRTELLQGSPVDEIVAYADTVDADLIVIGSRGHGAVLNALLGSVSRGVLHEARRPVLIVRGDQVPAHAAAS